MKRCRKCGEEKPHEAFGQLASSSDGLNPWCKACRNAAHRAWRARRPYAKREDRYRLPAGSVQRMLEEQAYRCAVPGCGNDLTVRFDVDHDHAHCPPRQSCGKCVRGLVCRRCNFALRIVDDAVYVGALMMYVGHARTLLALAA